MEAVQPILVVEQFAELHHELIRLLRGLRPEDWSRPTVAEGWTVKDMAAHLLDTDIRRLAFQRDRQPLQDSGQPITDYDDLVALIDRLNVEWTRAARRISPPVLVDFLSVVGPQVADLFRSLDPYTKANIAVSWAGEDESANWFDIAREYTEKWMHQQQIRDAVGAPGLAERRWLHPVLDTFLRGLPHTFRDVRSAQGTKVGVTITGEAGGDWTLLKEEYGWRLYSGLADDRRARVSIDQDAAWRLFTKGLTVQEARVRATIEGDLGLGERVLHLIAIMA